MGIEMELVILMMSVEVGSCGVWGGVEWSGFCGIVGLITPTRVLHQQGSCIRCSIRFSTYFLLFF